jgi:heme-degrading monooxygenase HmoA
MYRYNRNGQGGTPNDLHPLFQSSPGHGSEQHPGFVGIKTFVSDDGERLTVVRFRDEKSQREWKLDPMHEVAQQKGRTDFYERYRVAVCEVVRSYDWERHPEEPALLSSESDGSTEGDR